MLRSLIFSHYSFLFVSALAIILPSDAFAAQEKFISGDTHSREEADKDWEVTLGAGALALPEYEGGDEYEVLALPYIDIRYKDRVRLNQQGLTFDAVKHDGFVLGVGVGPDFGRDADDADRLNGLGDVDATAEGILYAGYRYGILDTRLTFKQDLIGDGHDGYTIEGQVSSLVPVPVGDKTVRLIPSVSTTYASDNYNESYFGVNARQSARSGLSQFDAEAGFKDVSAGLFATYPVTDNWSVNAITSYSYLIGDAGDSPIVEDENQLTGGLFIAYTF